VRKRPMGGVRRPLYAAWRHRFRKTCTAAPETCPSRDRRDVRDQHQPQNKAPLEQVDQGQDALKILTHGSASRGHHWTGEACSSASSKIASDRMPDRHKYRWGRHRPSSLAAAAAATASTRARPGPTDSPTRAPWRLSADKPK